MTTTTIWRARCRDCGLEQRRKTAPRRRNDAHNDLFCHDCVHPIEWQRWEVSEERGWKVGERQSSGQVWWLGYDDEIVVGSPGWIWRDKSYADEAAEVRRALLIDECADLVVIQRVVRRTLRRVP